MVEDGEPFRKRAPRLNDCLHARAVGLHRAGAPVVVGPLNQAVLAPCGPVEDSFRPDIRGEIADESAFMNPLIEAVVNLLDHRIHGQRYTVLTKQRKRAWSGSFHLEP